MFLFQKNEYVPQINDLPTILFVLLFFVLNVLIKHIIEVSLLDVLHFSDHVNGFKQTIITYQQK